MKGVAVGRNNWLFFRSEKGARSGANFYSIIRTAKTNGINPEKYLKFIFDNAHHLTDQELETLLPCNIDRSLLE